MNFELSLEIQIIDDIKNALFLPIKVVKNLEVKRSS